MKLKIIKRICFCMALFLTLTQHLVMAADFGDSGVDIVIIIDTSGSMRQTDKDQIAIEAAKLFIDMIEMSGSRVALVPFSDELGSIVDLTAINSTADKEYIKNVIDQLKYTGDTDIGMALQKGYQILEKSSNVGNHQAILFFTDGKIDLGDKRIRTDTDSLKDAREAASLSADAKIPIYTIGLNADGNVDKQLLSDLSTNTKGGSYIVNSAENLPRIFNEIFAEFISSNILDLGEFETNGVDFTEIIFNIPNNSVLEANIIMLSNSQLLEIELINPDGNIVLMDGQKAIMTTSKQYNMLKLIEPLSGDWNLRIKGIKGLKVSVNLIFNYKVSLESKAEVTTNGGGAVLAVTSWLEKEGTQLTDGTLYNAFSGQAFLQSDQGESTYPMQLSGNSFYVEIPIDNTKTYQVYTRVDSESMYRISDTITIDGAAVVPTSTPIYNDLKLSETFPDEIELAGFFAFLVKEKINLLDYITYTDKDKLIISYTQPDKSVAKASLNKDKILSISAEKNGETSIVLTIQDDNGESISKEIKITVKCKVTSIIPIIIAVIILIVIIILIIKLLKWNKERNRNFFGKIKWQIVGGMGTGTGREQVYDLSYEKGTIPITKVIADPQIAGFNLKKVALKMNSTNDSLIITCHDKRVSMTEGFGVSSKASIVLGGNGFTIITINNGGVEVALKVTFVLY